MRVHDDAVVDWVDDDDDEDVGRADRCRRDEISGRGDATMQCCVPGILAPVRSVRAGANRCD